MALSGGCRCGACRYALAYPSIPVAYTCHCLDCQTMSGAAFSLQAFIQLSRLSVDGELVEWEHRTSVGALVKQQFCATCKTRLFSVNDSRAGVAILRVGTLDESSKAEPAVHMWTKRKQPWITLPVDAEMYEETPPVERALALFAPNFL